MSSRKTARSSTAITPDRQHHSNDQQYDPKRHKECDPGAARQRKRKGDAHIFSPLNFSRRCKMHGDGGRLQRSRGTGLQGKSCRIIRYLSRLLRRGNANLRIAAGTTEWTLLFYRSSATDAEGGAGTE